LFIAKHSLQQIPELEKCLEKFQNYQNSLFKVQNTVFFTSVQNTR